MNEMGPKHLQQPEDGSRRSGSDAGFEQDDAFSRELRGAMQRVNAPDTLARFLAQAAAAEARRQSSGRLLQWFRPRGADGSTGRGLVLAMPRTAAPWFAGAVAALVVAGVGLGGMVHRQHERQQATEQFAQAEQIEQQTLEHTRAQLARAGVDLGQQ